VLNAGRRLFGWGLTVYGSARDVIGAWNATPKRWKGTASVTSVCAWCSKVMGEKPPFSVKTISHGICVACEKKMGQRANGQIGQKAFDKS